MEKIWVYQAERFLTSAEQNSIQQTLDDFVGQWNAHGSKLAGKADVLYNLFIVLQVDETVAAASGCSIDKSVHMLKDLERRLGISLFDRLNVAYRDSHGDISVVNRNAFQELCNNGAIAQDTIVFNNMISNGADFPHRWEVPFNESWHATAFRI